MESAVVGVAMEELEEDFGQARRWFDGTWAIYCVTCNFWVGDFREYRRHVDNNRKHQRTSPVLLKRGRKLIDKWEEHCMAMRSKGMDGQAEAHCMALRSKGMEEVD